MAKLGSPKTTKFVIGTAELRIGELSAAMQLTQAESVGLVDSVTVTVTQDSVDLEGGFPKVPVDTAIIRQSAEITGTLREYSRRNLKVMLGEGVDAPGSEPVDVATTADGAAAAAAVILPVADETGFSAGDVAVVYSATDIGQVSIVSVSDASTPGQLDLDAGTPLLHAVAVGDVVYKANQVAIGNIQKTNYFSCQMMQPERATGRPIGYVFWKATISAGLDYATNSEDFASTDLQLKLLQPGVTEYAQAGDPLFHVASLITGHPTGMYMAGGDS